MSKFLDYYGLERFWGHIDNIKQDKLTIDKELDATSHNPVENMAIKIAIDSLQNDMGQGNMFYYILLDQIIPHSSSSIIINTYQSSCHCLKYGPVVTIYFDIEMNYGNTSYCLIQKLPNDCRPFKKITKVITSDVDSFNNIYIDTDGQIILTSNNGIYNVHGEITYLVKPAGLQPDEPDASSIYNTSAKLIKIGNYFPTFEDNKIGGYTPLGAALMTDMVGTQFSGYENGYTIYIDASDAPLTPQYYTDDQTDFYWSKIFTRDLVNNKGTLKTFDNCYEKQEGSITETDLINHGIAMVKDQLSDTTTIQYFVTGFGRSPWIGGLNSPYQSDIQDKAYGGTSGAGNYNGRFYWNLAVLAHLFRFVPISADPVDKTNPVEIEGVIVGYIDKIIPLKFEDKAYSWANFSKDISDSTWRAIKIRGSNDTSTINDNFKCHLIFEDWINNNNTGNRYGGTYREKIDVVLEENANNISQGSIYYRPYSDWIKTTNKSLDRYNGSEFD